MVNQPNRTAIAKAPARGRTGFLYHPRIAPYVFVLPFILTFLIFFAYPVVSTVQMSFQEILPGATKYIGFENYEKLLNKQYYKAISNSLIYTALTLALLIPVPLVFAVMLNSSALPFKNVFRSAFFVPALVSIVVAGTIFRLMLGQSDAAIMNQVVGLLGIEPQKWLADARLGMLSLVLLATWRWLGVNIVYFLSGLQNIPQELYESASIDGASTWQKFIRITVPMLKPVSIYVLTISIFGGLSMFVESFTLWSGNRSPKDMGLTMVGYIYQQGFEQNNMGLGSAIGLSLLGLMLVLNLIQLKAFGLFRKED
ncbi:carbohydrate ABC transporter permease [Cohnella hongkongensis]|uniref:Carbohydrate ABC transporter permease n=1 Tax=Cohnella hongkongensis TaxID=178337 RepID=A0ABV9F6J1_9BACL